MGLRSEKAPLLLPFDGQGLEQSLSLEISQRTKQRMADPEVRQRIRDGMQAASGEAAEVQMLRLAWVAARPAARARFLVEISRADSEPGELIIGGVGGS
jgi:hypothetical protein